MGHAIFDSDGQCNGCRVLRLENELLRLEILPEVGGKIYRWIYKPLDRDWLWQRAGVLPAILPDGTNYDDHFSGGWDELFPNGDAGEHAGRPYPDHGEYWNKQFTWEIERSSETMTLHLSAAGTVTPTRMERWITMETDSPAVRIRYRLTHLGDRAFDYLWSRHPALNVHAKCELVVPGGKARNGVPGLGRLAPEPIEFAWPVGLGHGGRPVDLSRIPHEPTPDYDMAYIIELRDGWFGLLDRSARGGFGIAFDPHFFSCAWVFQTHGGWRGLHTAIIEPCTGYPTDLAQAVTAGRCARLLPGEVLETRVTAVSFSRENSPHHVGLDGSVS